MAAESHVIGVEGTFAGDIVVNRRFHHLQIRGGPVHLDVQSVAGGLESIAHVRVGDIPVVEIPDVIVISPGAVALPPEGIAQAEGQIVSAGQIKAGVRLGPGQVRIEAHAHGVLPVGGDRLIGSVEILKEDAGMGHLIEGGRQLRRNQPGGEGLSTDRDQVVVLQKPGVVVLPGGSHGGEILIQPLKFRIVGGGG